MYIIYLRTQHFSQFLEGVFTCNFGGIVEGIVGVHIQFDKQLFLVHFHPFQTLFDIRFSHSFKNRISDGFMSRYSKERINLEARRQEVRNLAEVFSYEFNKGVEA